MKLAWSAYLKTALLIGTTLFIVAISILLSFINDYCLFLLFLVVLEMFYFVIDEDTDMPDFIHMHKENEYIIYGEGKYYTKVYVKLFPGIFVDTSYRNETLESFQEEKLNYQHHEKETAKI